MQNGTPGCERAADAVCPADTPLSIFGFIVGIAGPILMLGLTFWLTSRFWYQLRSDNTASATTTIMVGYLALLLLGGVCIATVTATATNWGVLMIGITVPGVIVLFVYTPIWLFALLGFALTRKRPT